ncbi:hypothetical protein EWM64_g1038 [Hericium alpestre]|uniref:Hydrophobin n=1 Tax=Hericium alpestre TaxID=135208 RepID=A0A4Z0A9J5_9AGAM|nr:hypothetical protein EWM64_g1038 [Hericium alpestre]
MLSRISAICTYALVGMAAVAAAEPVRRGGAPTTTTVTVSNSPGIAGLLGLLGIVLQGVNIPVGVTCDPITVIGAGGASCNQQAVCCQNNNFNGLINIGCTPVNLNL